jgi:nucleotide-binding universal stress UspA family protein
MIAIKKVLVATDFSEEAESALNYGRAIARAFDATLLVLHVVEDVFARTGATEPLASGSVIAELLTSLEQGAREQMNEIVREDDRRELHAEAIVLTGLSAGVEIVRYAKDAGVDVIVMGTRGRGKIAALVMGSVAEKVVRLAPCPVLTVRHPEHEFIVPDALQRVERRPS